MNLGSRRWMIVSILIELAMDHKPSHREMASTLISDLYQKVISQRDIGKGEELWNDGTPLLFGLFFKGKMIIRCIVNDIIETLFPPFCYPSRRSI